ncbi:hypothetical protein GDO81_029984 [Engystomops pustulosus]|uniref:Uncharacterized protein n=1 Tax=Engystomops pustulosus TaxID=76066 RepID=A0AAV6YFH5_ENGPU|nr:hypothetical protein GDO81_029984 [Engystomops pustulosus]
MHHSDSWQHLHHHDSLVALAQRVLQQVGELGVPVGHMTLLGPQGLDDLPQGQQGLVNILRFLQPFALCPRLPHSLRACEIHQVQLP